MFRKASKKLSVVVSSMMILSTFAGVGSVSVKRTYAEDAISLKTYKFDFGSSTSPVATGYTQVTNTMIYNSERGYGLDKAVSFRDRGAPDDLRRDFINGPSYTFP
ncbi:putative secreted protein [Geobacillus sp. PA-3]|uniref:hypothetical protein n=1 Tax=Geobacillus sp. PA-3 TaxID=1699078 RepID=UPI0006E5A024|nr:hypothetical protein [Geobacillus sp. PA-3]KQB94498.1 putative secreted protein [Geobacillus sp. PA-3]